MKCSSPACNHSIGLVSYRRGFFGKRPYCSKTCRDNFVAERVAPPQSKRPRAETYFEFLFAQPIAHPQPQLAYAAVRVRAR
jgi:hypothetical protein